MKKSKVKNPFELTDWSDKSLQDTWKIIQELAVKKYGLTYYTPSFEVVSFEDMLNIQTHGMPIMYSHWSFGRQYIDLYNRYLAGQMSTPYEVIFNTSPALCYLMEHNSPTMQGLVQAHAAIGHSSFFKNNVLFKEQTNAATIIPFLKNAKSFISDCETQYGHESVEELLDACHALSYYAVDRRPAKVKTQKEREEIRLQRAKSKEEEYDSVVDTIKIHDEKSVPSNDRFREENILKFIGKHSPSLKGWQREIIKIYCQIQQYFYPQILTKTSNEGFASFWHHTIMHDLIDMGLIPPNGAIEFIHSHCGVLRQPNFDERGYYGVNPYKLGFEIYKDIQRICTNPTDEDKDWFPDLIGKNWIDEVKFAAYNFKDESFILQYLSPKLIRDLKLFVVKDDAGEPNLLIDAIHDDEGYKTIRKKLASAYNHFDNIPDLYIEGWDNKKSRKLYLVFKEKNDVALGLDDATHKTALYVKQLWGFNIVFKYINTNGSVTREEG